MPLYLWVLYLWVPVVAGWKWLSWLKNSWNFRATKVLFILLKWKELWSPWCIYVAVLGQTSSLCKRRKLCYVRLGWFVLYNWVRPQKCTLTSLRLYPKFIFLICFTISSSVSINPTSFSPPPSYSPSSSYTSPAPYSSSPPTPLLLLR